MVKKNIRKIYLLFEFVLFFLGVPLFLFLRTDLVHPASVLVPFAIVVFAILFRSKGFKPNELFHFPVTRDEVLRQMAVVIFVALLMTGWVYFFDRNDLFNLPRENWRVWLLIVIFYPVFSAFTQEVIFRLFIFKRYRELFKNGLVAILVSAAVFSFAHLFYYHRVSLILTFILGIYLGWVYNKTHSVIFTSILHGLMGLIVFTVGLGEYFWLDIHRWM